MRPSNESRRAVAARYAAAYAAAPDVTAVILGGSTGRGHADRWSDVELGVFWAAPPTEEQRRAGAADAHEARFCDFDTETRAWYDDLWHGAPAGRGLLIEAVHTTVADAHAVLDKLQGDPDPETLTFAAALAYGEVLAGDADALRERVAVYPEAVRANVIRRLGQIDHFWRWRMYVDRQDSHGLRVHFAEVVTHLTHVLCALNGRWWPGAKWPQWTLGSLERAPAEVAVRMAAVDVMPADEAAAELTGLVRETYDLVEQHLPQVDVARLREIFAFVRSAWG